MRITPSSWLLAVAILATVSGCTMSPYKRQGMLIGAAGGALFSGAAVCGTAAALASQNSNAVAIACPLGIVGGAIIGGTFGYFLTRSPEFAQTSIPPPPLTAQDAVSPPLSAHQAALPPPLPGSFAARPPPPPPRVTTEQRIALRGVHFGSQSADLSAADKAILDAAAANLKAHPGAKIYVKGYADGSGSTAQNEKLSQERAAVVAAYLESQGVALSQLIVRGARPSHFAAENDTRSGLARNHSVDLELVMGYP